MVLCYSLTIILPYFHLSSQTDLALWTREPVDPSPWPSNIGSRVYETLFQCSQCALFIRVLQKRSNGQDSPEPTKTKSKSSDVIQNRNVEKYSIGLDPLG